MPKTIPYANEQEWLDLRLEDITSTESAALFGLSPYMTKFELWHNKKNRTAVAFTETNRTKWGKRMESTIAEGVAKDLGIKVRPMKCYMRHDSFPRMGSSFDYEIYDHPNGPGIMEIKGVDYIVHRDNWTDNEAPPHIEVQKQHQYEVADMNWGLVVAFVGGNDPHIIERKRDREIGRILREKIADFWQSIRDNRPPAPDYEKDAEFIIGLHQSAGEKVYEAGDPYIEELLAGYKEASQQCRKLEKTKDAKKAELLEFMGNDYNKAMVGDFTLHCGMSKETPPTVITEDMVGQTYGGRKRYRVFRVTERKEGK